MPRRYWYVMLTYILMQVSGFVGVPLLGAIWGFDLQNLTGNQESQLIVTWNLISFPAALIIILLLLRPDMKETSLTRKNLPISKLLGWSLLGIILAYVAQIIAGLIEMGLGIPQASENTQQLMNFAKSMPIFILIITVLAPILEELLFRKVLFGSIYKKTNFIIAALISSLIFAVVHMDLMHTIKYTAMGLVFAFLYVQTKRIIVPIIAHMAMNLIVVLIQFTIDPEQIEQWEKQLEQAQTIIGG
ncbi:CPBP family intramembrane metalloprotease [Pontibacillus yanchengensis]|uniref:CPBP family intramembrane metalloprotease n=2 Tax=Pontibacillus yanchengensis TaxID=462910 RepID=A0A6I5A625_9BACI|nr:type II CAAX endopeptidase family protein [Pontibacillus yanchengensis]MYL35744.1 CPBP family intramembrane metalloprotease [Pontibacillus yanchengensis]MYL55453.1 CPBP family intramembrane metalloprotease [Pontibacillus yanchengensis]